jgi:hypothetical protein
MTVPDIPLLDITLWRNGTADHRARLADRLDAALRQSGFLMIENHGVAAGLREQIRESARAFFALPDRQKAAYATAVGGRGWIPPGGEANAFYGEMADPARADLKESLTIGRTFRTGNDASIFLGRTCFLFLVVRGRERLALAFGQELVLVFFPPDLGPFLLVLLGVTDVGVERRGIGGRRDVVRGIVIKARVHALLFCLMSEPVVVKVLRRAAVLAAIPVELFRWLI